MQRSTSEYVLFNQTCLLFSSGPKPTQKQLLQQLYNTVPDKWHPIGVYLEIPNTQLNAIDAKHHGDPQKCLMAMLTESWLPRVSPPPTWQEIAEAVEFVGYPNVAHTLRDKFCEFCVIYTVQLTFIAFFFLLVQVMRPASLYSTGLQKINPHTHT